MDEILFHLTPSMCIYDENAVSLHHLKKLQFHSAGGKLTRNKLTGPFNGSQSHGISIKFHFSQSTDKTGQFDQSQKKFQTNVTIS